MASIAGRILFNTSRQIFAPSTRLVLREKSSLLSHNYRSIHCTRALLAATADRYYTDKHEWITVIDNVATIGITDYAQEALGDIVFAQLPDIGTKLKAKDECGALESVKAASEIYCPATGVVLEKNVEVENTPALINTNCYDKGWLFKIKLDSTDEISKLMDEDKYKKYLETEAH